MIPLRADDDPRGGIFQKPMFERLVVCEFAVADLSYGNANVYYELGIRHGLRPYSTVLVFREGWALPLDVAHGSALAYTVDSDGQPIKLTETRSRLVARLRQARDAQTDSPVFQLVTGLPVPEVDHERIDSFRDHADRDERLRRRLNDAVVSGVEELRRVEYDLGDLSDLDYSTLLSITLAYRSVSAWSDVVRVIRGASKPVSRLYVVRQQYAWALNRCGQDAEAERITRKLLSEKSSSETYGLLGRIYKDRWLRAQSKHQAHGLLHRAIDAYLKGFETDWRDPYPGVNAVMLMSLVEPPDPGPPSLLSAVRYAIDRRLARTEREPDYWDHATDLSLRVLEGNQSLALKALSCALAVARDPYEPQTTARDIKLLGEAAARRGVDAAWILDVVEELEAATLS